MRGVVGFVGGVYLWASSITLSIAYIYAVLGGDWITILHFDYFGESWLELPIFLFGIPCSLYVIVRGLMSFGGLKNGDE